MSSILSLSNQLKPIFEKEGVNFHSEENFIIASSLTDSLRHKVESFIKSKYCPFFYFTHNEQLVFTVVPYKIPSFFHNKDIFIDFNLSLKEQDTKSHKDHCKRIKNGILSLSHNLNGSALVLGYGNGNDIPLKKLARNFTNITLVDYDDDAMERAIQFIPPEVRSKITLLKRDLTCLVENFNRQIDSLNFDFPLDHNLRILTSTIIDMCSDENCLKFTPQFPKQYGFVSSSMLNSQLFSLLMVHIEKKLHDHYPDCTNLIQQPEFNNAANHLFKLISLNHVAALTNASTKEGRIFYADHPILEEVIYKKGSVFSRRDIHAIPIDFIENKFNHYFTLQYTEQWIWEVIKSKTSKLDADKTIDNLAHVKALALIRN